MSSTSLSDVDVKLIDDIKPELGIILKYKGGVKCNEMNNWGMTI